MGVREARIEEGRNYIGEDRVDEMVVTIKLVIFAEKCGGVSARRVEVFKTTRRVLMAGREKSYTDPSAGGAKATETKKVSMG